jgi:hypothetical protein
MDMMDALEDMRGRNQQLQIQLDACQSRCKLLEAKLQAREYAPTGTAYIGTREEAQLAAKHDSEGVLHGDDAR